jgi:hypothetical protein
MTIPLIKSQLISYSGTKKKGLRIRRQAGNVTEDIQVPHKNKKGQELTINAYSFIHVYDQKGNQN